MEETNLKKTKKAADDACLYLEIVSLMSHYGIDKVKRLTADIREQDVIDFLIVEGDD